MQVNFQVFLEVNLSHLFFLKLCFWVLRFLLFILEYLINRDLLSGSILGQPFFFHYHSNYYVMFSHRQNRTHNLTPNLANFRKRKFCIALHTQQASVTFFGWHCLLNLSAKVESTDLVVRRPRVLVTPWTSLLSDSEPISPLWNEMDGLEIP